MRHADTPYVAFSDDDSWWTPGALRQAADLLDVHPRLGCWPPARWSVPTKPRTRSTQSSEAHRFPARPTCRGVRCSASWAAPAWCAGTRSSQRAGTTRCSSSAGRRPCSPMTSRPMAWE
ncbi:hypothetical protein QQY66_06815 [Streptomyces sp. DG2A-72]|uniref:glycosyltransferase n=1 Tax=Streptomyces sp. DG2A-72 TaxID=3051386 RepID=UPI00265BDCC0|nr:glycosyltransferase [Streptomyces sp. DG2A-72]MDO0931403.1 hypothetical protein [Streptomyces sp. DG2A-72]